MNIETNERYLELLTRLREAEKVVIGLGGEWKLADDGRPVRERRLSDDPAQKRLRAAYEALYELVKDKDYYLVTTVTDGAIYLSLIHIFRVQHKRGPGGGDRRRVAGEKGPCILVPLLQSGICGPGGDPGPLRALLYHADLLCHSRSCLLYTSG